MTRHIITIPSVSGNDVQKIYQGMVPPDFDRIVVGYPNTTTETYSYYLWDNLSADYILKGRIEAVYTDATKENLSVVTRVSI